MLTRVEIKGFKCLHDVRVGLKPFNVLIGPNDSGKSSFLQAIEDPSRGLRAPPRIRGMKNHRAVIDLHTKESNLYIGSDESGQLFAELEGNRNPWDSDALRAWQRRPPIDRRTYLNVSEPVMLEAIAIASPSPRGSGSLARLISSRGQGTAAHIARVALGDRDRYEAIQQGMRDVTGGRVREVIVGEDMGKGYPLSFRLHDGAVIPAADLSQGLLLYLGFLALIHRDDAPAVLLVEEPENGLHPLRLFEVVTLLRTLTERGVQIIMTTHSPDLLNACKPEEVLIFRRPEVNSGTEIHRLPADFERRAMGDTLGQIWASSGEEGLLDMLPKVEPSIRTEVP